MKPANLFDPPGHSDDASSFRAGLDEIRSASDVDVGEYFDGSDVLPKRAKGRIVDIVGDSGRSASDAVDARDALRNLDGVSDISKTRFLEAGDVGSIKFLSEVDQGTVDKVFDFDVDGDAALADRVRGGIAQAYSRESFSLSTDDGLRWTHRLYPDAEKPSDVAEAIADDINKLESGDGIDGDIEGLARTLSRGDGGGSGAYLERLPGPENSQKAVKGAALELRTARQAAGDLDTGDTLRMSVDPDVDFEDLSSTARKDVAEKVYGVRSEDAVADDLTTNPEFDAVQEITDADGNTRLTYLESKNTGSAPTQARVEGQSARFFASMVEQGKDIDDLGVTYVTRTESQATDLNTVFDEEWFNARASSTESE